jgi:hypothetical protein
MRRGSGRPPSENAVWAGISTQVPACLRELIGYAKTVEGAQEVVWRQSTCSG